MLVYMNMYVKYIHIYTKITNITKETKIIKII